MIQLVDKKNIVQLVTKEVGKAKKEILATMLLSEEIVLPLPSSYHALLRRKVKNGISLKRLGFGTKGDYNAIREKYVIDSKRYTFRYTKSVKDYQRLIIVDGSSLFFGVNGLFFQSTYRPLVTVFSQYFLQFFKEGKL